MTKLLAIFDAVPGWIYAIALAVIATSLYTTVAGNKADLARSKAETSAVKATLEKERREASDAALAAEKALRDKERDLTYKADADRKELNHEILTITAQRDTALGELRKRPSRPAVPAASAGVVPTAPSDGQAVAGCTGAELYRDDGELLVRESARAETIRQSLLQCYRQYDRARAEIQELTQPATDANPQ